MIVVDVGCFAHGDPGAESIPSLCRHFSPSTLYGFDPLVADTETVFAETRTKVVTRSLAAWIEDGEVLFTEAGLQSALGTEAALPSSHPTQPTRSVACFDLATWLATLPRQKIVLKLDVEGAEIPLLEHLHTTGADNLLSLLLVEEHPHLHLGPLPEVRCPLEAWWM